jgi:hypothetical protein
MKELGKWGVSLILYLLLIVCIPLIVAVAAVWCVLGQPVTMIHQMVWRKREKRNPQ